jgi:hypothetical protein
LRTGDRNGRLAATGRTIGLGNDADKKIMRFKQRFERCGSDLGACP